MNASWTLRPTETIQGRMLLDLWRYKSHSNGMPQQPLQNKVTKVEYSEEDKRFVIHLEVEVPPNVSQVEVETTRFGDTAHAMPLINPPAGPAEMLINGEGHAGIKTGDSLPVWSTWPSECNSDWPFPLLPDRPQIPQERAYAEQPRPCQKSLFGVLRRLRRCQRQEAASKDLVESRTLSRAASDGRRNLSVSTTILWERHLSRMLLKAIGFGYLRDWLLPLLPERIFSRNRLVHRRNFPGSEIGCFEPGNLLNAWCSFCSTLQPSCRSITRHLPGSTSLRQPEFRSLAFKRWVRRKSCGINRFLRYRKSRQLRGDPQNLTDPYLLGC